MSAAPVRMSRPFTARSVVLLGVALLAACLLAPPAEAQYFRFGKNKVQYQTLDWQFLQSTHFDVFYYEPGGEALAAFTARAAEEAYTEIEALFGHRISDRITILVYQSHNDFAVTNAADLPAYAEGIGGVTEGSKNRVALPFTGDYRDFRRVLHHELVHAVTNDMLHGGAVQRIVRHGSRGRLPLWFTEGLAEYAALGWDTHSDMVLREAVVNDGLPPIPHLRGYFAYRGGQGVFDYVAAQYGREKVTEIIQRVQAGATAETAVRRALGLDIDGLSERWHAALKAVYFPEVAAREDLGAIARPLASRTDGRRFSTSAAISPQGDRVAFLTAREALFDVYVVETTGDASPRRLIAGQRNPDFESFRILTPGLSWNPQGTQLAVAVKAGASEAVALVDTHTGRARHLRFPELGAILSVRWSPDGRHLALSATRGPQSDLYLFDLETEALTNLTDDVFSAHEPAWAPDGRSIVFHSDRGGHLDTHRQQAETFDMAAHDYNRYALYRLRLDAPDRLERMGTGAHGDARSAAFGADPNRILFVSDRNGVDNLYEHDLTTGRERPLTDLLTGVTQVSLSRDGRTAALVALNDGVSSLFLLREPFTREVAPPAPTVWAQRSGRAGAVSSPALAVAHPTTADENPLLREATSPLPYAHRRHAPPPPEPTSRPEPLWAVLPEAEDRVDFRAYAFSDAFEEARDARNGIRIRTQRDRFAPQDNLREDGSFQPRPYRLRFSPDFVYGDLGYDAVFGVQSAAQMAFSDLLGNHRIVAATNLVVDLRNADYLLSYQYLPHRTDYALTGFHLARQLTDFSRQAVFRYRNYGLVAAAAYPLDKFRRVEAELSLQGVSLTNLVDPMLQARDRAFLYPALTYTADHTVPGRLAPSGGQRYAVRLSGSPGPGVAFGSVLADARQYAGDGMYALALRASGGLSVGPDPQRFYAAGVQNWVNPTFGSMPIRDENDFVFGTPVLPLRGHAFDAASGDRFALLNAEVRVPLVAALLPGPLPVLPLYNLQAVAFADVATIYSGSFSLLRDGPDGERVLDDLYAGAGLGLRTVALGYPFRLDWAWPFDGHRFGSRQLYLSIGLDF